MKTLVIIPSRLSASRLPGKPLLKINGLSIISHVYKKAQEADIGDVIVATEDQEIVEDVRKQTKKQLFFYGNQAITFEPTEFNAKNFVDFQSQFNKKYLVK